MKYEFNEKGFVSRLKITTSGNAVNLMIQENNTDKPEVLTRAGIDLDKAEVAEMIQTLTHLHSLL